MSGSTVTKLDQESDEFGRVFSSVIELLREEGKTQTESRKEAFESLVRNCNAKTRREKLRLIVIRRETVPALPRLDIAYPSKDASCPGCALGPGTTTTRVPSGTRSRLLVNSDDDGRLMASDQQLSFRIVPSGKVVLHK
jgi:hypothetical protein